MFKFFLKKRQIIVQYYGYIVEYEYFETSEG